MDLIRLDSNPHPNPDEYPNDHRRSEYGIEMVEDYSPESARLRVNFYRFGLGEKRKPSFAVELDWFDVRHFIREFIEAKQPEALYLQSMLRLAEAIEQAGWSPNDSPPENFWDILPPRSE